MNRRASEISIGPYSKSILKLLSLLYIKSFLNAFTYSPTSAISLDFRVPWHSHVVLLASSIIDVHMMCCPVC